MVPEMKDLTYKESLKEMGLPALQDRRERDVQQYMEKVDRQDLESLKEDGGRWMKGHSKTRGRFKVCGAQSQWECGAINTTLKMWCYL